MSAQLTDAQLHALVDGVYPGAQVDSCRLFPGQHDNLNYDLSLSSPRMDAVLKVYTHQAGAQTEVYLLRTLTSETGVPVPRVLHHDDSLSMLDRVWCLQTRLSGGPLSKVIGDLDPWQVESLGYETGRYLGRIHQLALGSYGRPLDPGEPAYGTEDAFVADRTAAALRQPRLSASLAPERAQYLENALTRFDWWNTAQACLIHGRYAPNNVIVERGTTDYHVSGVIEFGYSAGGSPEEDIAHMLHWTPPETALEKGLLDGYVESGKLDKHFWERLRCYQVLVALEALAYRDLTPESIESAVKRLAAFDI